MKTTIHFIKKEFLQFKRDPKMFVLILGAPIIQLIFLGYAATFDVNVVHTAVYDMDKSQESRKYIESFKSTGYFAFDYYVDNYSQLTQHIDNANVILGLVIPRGFENKIQRGETVKVQAIFDGSDGNTASIAAGYLQGITQKYSKEIVTDIRNKLGIKALPVGSVKSSPRVWYNPELTTRNFMVPGIVGLLLMIITLILTSLAIVKEKEVGTLEQLIVTPIKPYQMIVGKLVPFAILGFTAVILVISAMNIIFGIAVKGSVLFLLFSSFVFILSTLGLGLFVSTISKTQQQAMMLAIFLVSMPMIFLSGFAFPIENMPDIIQAITYVIPLRYFMTIIRGVILKGIGISDLWFELLAMFGIGMLILSLSVMRFQKRLD
ncbi:abc-type multidrug transport system, permease component [hydrocarbon metagenome]|uniref:Abc-type multidrug transport system, permease component n=1 Tax=hydrocarbon metagenome TaxID=938273 RepID=A0A0W8FXI1_9ZZZZ